MVGFSRTVVALSALAATNAQLVDWPIPQLKEEYLNKHDIVTDTVALPSNESNYVFLQKFPLQGSILGLHVYHTEILVCPRAGFSKGDQNRLDKQIEEMTDFAEVKGWETKTAPCVELGYGGALCTQECCGVGKIGMPLNKRQAVIGNADLTQKSVFIYGTGSFDGNVAFHNACDKKCWSNFAGDNYNILTCNCNTFTSTILSCVYGLSQKKPDLGISDAITVHGHCPATADVAQVLV